MSKHSLEPWKILDGFPLQIYSQEGWFICETYTKNRSHDINVVNAERIIQCVNACAGMENPDEEIAQLKADKARLIEALEISTEHIPHMNIIMHNKQLLTEMEGE